MQEERLKILLEFLKEEPTVAFNRYALAMEFMQKDEAEAQKHLEILIGEHPDYLASYYQLALLYFDQDEFEKAEIVYKKGIILAGKLGNNKIEKELRGAYEMLKSEM